MRRVSGRLIVGFLGFLIPLACGGNPAGPSTATPPGTITFDGQAIQGTPDGSIAFNRAPGGLNWVDLVIGSCSSTGISITLKEVDFPPRLGSYAISKDLDVVSANASISGQEWFAGQFWMGIYCGDPGGVLPACPVGPGGGSVTVSSSSRERIAGSYRFTMVQRNNYSGLLINRPPPVTKLVEGIFDLEFDDRVVDC